MANDVFANGREISCKAGDGKSICAFPDVCITPPENPATPPGVPIPYPNTGMASDTTEGSKSVKISGKEIMLKNKSYFKKSLGDEAGCAAKKGIITSVHRGKVYFISWSMDVNAEGENVVRHLDMTTHNHSSPMSNGALGLHQDSIGSGGSEDCRFSQRPQEIDPQGTCNHTFNCGDYGCGGCVEPDAETCGEYVEEQNREANERASDPAKQRTHLENENANLSADNARLQNEIDQGLPADQASKHQRAIALNNSTIAGNKAELQVADSLGDDIQKWGYVAHCTTCHLTTEIDFVTSDRVIEVKANIGTASVDQFTKRTVPTMNACPEIDRENVELRSNKPKEVEPEPFETTKKHKKLQNDLSKSGKSNDQVDKIMSQEKQKYLDRSRNKAANDITATEANLARDYGPSMKSMGKTFSFKWM